MTPPISVFIITKNEASRIARTINAVKGLCSEIVLVDSGSTDETVSIAESLGARSIYNAWPGYGAQKKFAESQCEYDWLLNVDADEVVTESLKQEILALFQNSSCRTPEAYIARIVDVMPGDTRPGVFAYAHKYIRLYHKKVAEYSSSPVHDVVQLKVPITPKKLKNPIFHYSVYDFRSQVEKYNSYTDALVNDLKARKIRKPAIRLFVEFPIAFLKSYILRRHVLRGTYGFLTSMNYAYFRFLRLAKLYEKEKHST